MKLWPVVIIAFAALAGGCVENEEVITIRPDGSVNVKMRAAGEVWDVADGYPVPLHGPWSPATEETTRWINTIGGDTGSAAVRARASQVDWEPAKEGKKKDKAELAVEASFPNVAAWPQHFAPESEPYRTALLRRSANLKVEKKGARTVYTFERTFHRRDTWVERVMDAAHDRIPEELRDRFDRPEPITEAEWDGIAGLFFEAYQDTTDHLVRGAVLGIYTLGDASLPPATLERIVTRCQKAVAGLISKERIVSVGKSFRQRVLRKKAGEEVEGEDENPLDRFEEQLRRFLRETLTRALDEAGVPSKVRNAILYRLEWHYTAADHTGDIGDEKFIVKVTMPGTVVGGNFDKREGDTVRWEFKGEYLHDRDVVLRVVSVVE